MTACTATKIRFLHGWASNTWRKQSRHWGGMKRRIAGKPINLGFLLGTRRYDCNIDAFAVGSVLTISVKRLIQEQGLGVFDCRIEGPGVYISANLNVYHPDDALDRTMASLRTT